MQEKLIEDPVFDRLQFSQEWIDLGIITVDNFALIKKEYLKGKDLRTEHYRWGVFNVFIKNSDFIVRDKFYKLYQLGKKDPDYAMGRAMIFELIARLDCPKELIDTATNDCDVTLAKYALKCQKSRE
ncbi:MAG: hypothetical protein ACRC2R_25500 [Xenococcaceae cyanobacterium]